MSIKVFQHNKNHWLGVKLLFHSSDKECFVRYDNLPIPVISEDDSKKVFAKWNCDDLRRKIKKLTGFGGEMKKAEFLRLTEVNSKSYYSFMKLKGCCKGITNQTFLASHQFFEKHELKSKTPKGVATRKIAKQKTPTNPISTSVG